MRIAFNLINLISSGTLMTGISFLEALAKHRNQHNFVILAPSNFGYESVNAPENIEISFFRRGKFNAIWRVWFDFLMVPYLVRKFRIEVFISLGNHAPANLNIPKIVLFRNSYYTNWDDYEVKSWEKVVKYLERFMFGLTVKSINLIVAQSSYMKERLALVWKIPAEKIKIIPNALSNAFVDQLQNLNYEDTKRELKQGKLVCIYVSRYYAHKNHSFLLSIAGELKKRAIRDVVFAVTVNPMNPNVIKLQSKINEEGLNAYFINLGEITQRELHEWYQKVNCVIFPSKLETFGNPLIEAMAYGLPICAIDLPYARSVCEDAAIYFRKDDVQDGVDKILSLKSSTSLRALLAAKGRQRFQSFPTWDEIVSYYIELSASLYGLQKVVGRK